MKVDKLVHIREQKVDEIELWQGYANKVKSVHATFDWNEEFQGYEVRLDSTGQIKAASGERRYVVNDDMALAGEEAVLVKPGDRIDRYAGEKLLGTLILHDKSQRYIVYKSLSESAFLGGANSKRVLLCVDTHQSDNLVVLKYKGGDRTRFERSSQTLSRIISLYIPRLYDYGEIVLDGKKSSYQSFEYFPSETLGAKIKDEPLSLQQAPIIFGQVCEAVADLHRIGYAHRFLKPEHILIGHGNHVKLAGLSLLRRSRDEHEVSLSGDGETEFTFTEVDEIVGPTGYVPTSVQDGRQKDGIAIASLFVYCILPAASRKIYLESIEKGDLRKKRDAFLPKMHPNLAELLFSILTREKPANIEALGKAFFEAAGYDFHDIRFEDQYPTSLNSKTVIKGLELAVWYQPLETVGGDFCGHIQTAKNRYALFIGDAMGHGLRSCLARHIIQPIPELLAEYRPAPGQVLAKMDEQLHKMHLQNNVGLRGMYATAFYGEFCLEPRNRYLQFANAGHPLPVLLRGDKVMPLRLRNSNFTGCQLGMGSEKFESMENFVSLETKDLLVFFTDGVFEFPEAGEYYEDHFLQALGKCPDREPRRVIEYIEKYIGDLLGSTPFQDDITLIAIQIR